MAQSHKFCDHPATKSARAKCRASREQGQGDYQGGWDKVTECPECLKTGGHASWCSSYRPRQRQQRSTGYCRECGTSRIYGHASWCSQFRANSQGNRRYQREYPRYDCCGNYQAAGHSFNCPNRRQQREEFNWDDLFGTRRTARTVSNPNGGYKVTDYGKGREDYNRDDQARTPEIRRIVQLERKAESAQGPERAAFFAGALRLRTAAGLVGQVL